MTCQVPGVEIRGRSGGPLKRLVASELPCRPALPTVEPKIETMAEIRAILLPRRERGLSRANGLRVARVPCSEDFNGRRFLG